MSDVVSRLGLLDLLRDLAKKGASLEASIITTYSFNGLFYEEVILRALERAGSRLNVLLVDAQQLAVALQDPVMRPQRAGKDYILIPVDIRGAFHPKLAVLLSPKRPLLAVGSHNATESGYARNDEVTVCWGHQSGGVPRDVLNAVIGFVLDWLRAASGPDDLIEELSRRLLRLSDETLAAPSQNATFLGWRPDGASLLEQLSGLVPHHATRVSVISPYFDANLKLLNSLASGWAPNDIVVGIQPQGAMLAWPDQAPVNTRFVEFVPPEPTRPADVHSQPAFLHGKIIAFETPEGPFVVLGSPNASAPAWLQSTLTAGNAEAAVLLSGDMASAAFVALGLERLATAPSLSLDDLAAIAARTKKSRELEEQSQVPKVPVVSAIASDGGWLIPGLNADTCRTAHLITRGSDALPGTTFENCAGGVALSIPGEKIGNGVVRIDGDDGPLAFAILNDTPALRRLLRPREAGRLLDALGRIDQLDGFDDFFDLFDRHIFGSDTTTPSETAASRRTQSELPETGDEPTTPGPRGISLASILTPNGGRAQLDKDDLAADLIKAVIHSLALAGPIVPDGDAPDIDEDDATPGSLVAVKLDVTPSLPPGEWARLVTACRKRIGVLIGRLGKRLNPLPTDIQAVSGLAGKVLIVMLLLQKLRQIQPHEDAAQNASSRPESLVSAAQLRAAFKLVMRALYTVGGLATVLESNSGLRGSEDRRLLDTVMLWTAREIGVDFDIETRFNEDPQIALIRQQDRIDGLVSAVSAAGHGDISLPILDLPVWPWGDAPRVKSGWVNRHLALGAAFQARLAEGDLPTLQRPVATRDIVVWRKEPRFPRLVSELGPKKATLPEPGEQAGSEPLKVHPDFLAVLDLASLRADAAAQSLPGR